MQTIDEILRSGIVSNGTETFPLESSVTEEEGALIQRVIRDVKPDVYLEVGLAYGISALFAGEALRNLEKPYAHYIIDPSQDSVWSGVGRYQLQQRGMWDAVNFLATGSEFALPQLAQAGIELDVAFIDGWHTFDHAMIDFFYINRMLKVGGVVIFDDADWPAISKLVSYARSYPCFESYDASDRISNRSLMERLSRFRPLRSKVRAIALRKKAPDERSWDWYEPF